MQKPSSHYLVGIDLGTTHTVVAYAKAEKNIKDIHLFQVEQLIAPGQVAARSLLPSVRYHLASGEISQEDINFSNANLDNLATDNGVVVGEVARLLASKTQGRFVTSAKSWLSHPSVEHSASILPWGASDDVHKVSPIEASASYLAHIRSVWNRRFPGSPLENQDVVITVPASFDEGARALTVEAARIAGLDNIRLLEEPQAVCYDWLRRNTKDLDKLLGNVRLLLVCDVGGGTTDLTLIKVEPGEKEPKLTRIGVGEHLMLGGDNIDLALAHIAEGRLQTGDKRLSAANLAQLIEQCRQIKEGLLATDAPEQMNVTLLGGGSKLIGGSRSVVISREEVRSLALDGFFPLSKLDELPDKKRSGVVEFGLPYTAEPAVSKHIAAFLQHHASASNEALSGEGIVPEALLLNGGVFQSEAITQRILDLVNSWSNKSPVLLENKHPELAVAYGAVSYAIARKDKKLKIGGGAARSYFLLLDNDKLKTRQGVCILPRGSEEGDEIILGNRRFALRLGVPVRFHLVSTTADTEYKAGDVTTINDFFHSLPPLAVAFESSNATSREAIEVIVQLAVTQTETGTLKIQCLAVDDVSKRWNVEFQLRKKAQLTIPADAALPAQFANAVLKIQAVFGAKSMKIEPGSVKNLRADLEKLLGERSGWSIPLLRALFNILLDGEKFRRRSENHERAWFGLVGFCLRPGFGFPLDDWRVEQVWKVYSQGIQFVNESQNWAEWWILWRRIAGGLNETAQEQIFNDISKFINPASARQATVAKLIKIRAYDDMVRLSAVLERLPPPKKIQSGEWLLSRLQKGTESAQTWWAVGRIASRVPFHGSTHNVIPADIASKWLESMLAEDWKKIPQAGFAASLISRMSGDRVRDIDDVLRVKIIEKLKQAKAPASWIVMIEQFKQLDEKEEQQMFGEALPPGLKLV